MRLDRLLEALSTARPGGHRVEAWSVFSSESRGLSLGVKDREVGNPHVPLKLGEACGARYRLVWDDGLVSRGSVERRLLEDDPGRALSNARSAAYDDPDAAHVAGPAAFPEVELWNAGAAALAGGEVEPLVSRLDAVRRCVAEGGFRTWSGSFSAAEARSRVLSSAGLDASSEGTSIGWHVTLNGEIGDGHSARAAESQREFDARLERLARTATLLEQAAEPPVPGVHPVLFHPHVVESYVLSTLLHNLGGSTVAHDEGHFRREQFGSDRPVLREDLGLRIDPLVPLRSGSYRYTTEGVPAARCTFLERGRLVQPVLDMKYARRLGLAPTPLPSDDDTLHLEGPPLLDLDEALSRAGGGAIVLSVLGAHTQDSASGDFSLGAPQALVVRDDRVAGRVRGTISGNLFDVLSGDDLSFVRFEGEHTPGLLVSCRLDPQ
jgi:PmbA protein